MSRTMRKLEEAKFFLEKLEAAVAEYPDFDYFFSAFVSSARSVTWVMKAEYKEHAGWLAWYENRKPKEAEQLLLKQMNDLRTRSEKFNPLKTTPAVVFNIPPDAVTPELREYLDASNGKRFKTWIFPVSEDDPLNIPEGVPKGASVIFVGPVQEFVHHVPELNDQDVVSASKAYYATLKLLLDEAEAVANEAQSFVHVGQFLLPASTTSALVAITQQHYAD